jgi:dihydropteroate synthase
MFTWKLHQQLAVFDSPRIMGIINATPDSFVEGHLGRGLDGILALVAQMRADGVDWVDVGGQSTRPGSIRLDVGEEITRVIPVIEAIRNTYPDLPISIDTYHASVAQAAVQAGASIVNDVSGGQYDESMLTTVGKLGVPYILMHAPSTPNTMHQSLVEKEQVFESVMRFFRTQIHKAREAGIVDLALDPGFGFGKTPAANFHLLFALDQLKVLALPVLAGISRKRMIWQTIGATPETALNGTTALHMLALEKGATILRVHDVRAAWEARTLWMAVQNGGATT